MTEGKPRLVGINHVAMEVGDVTAALAFYGSIFSFSLPGTIAMTTDASRWHFWTWAISSWR